jgi:antitoxin (DNA-binding transcriptional repressor) of toxin-antitoxin stability system
MIKAAVSEFKAKLSSYLRLVKAGERIEIQDRGITVGVLSGLPSEEESLVIPASKSPKLLAQFKSKITLEKVDAVRLLLDDRSAR